MKRFKPNKLTTFIFFVFEFFAPFCIEIPIIILLTKSDNLATSEIFSMFSLPLIILVLFIVVSCMLNLFTLPFTKHTVFLYKDHFSCENSEVRYDDVTKIEFDSGLIKRFGRGEPCCLDCYVDDKLLISIEYPSLLMSFLVWRRCKNAKFRYKRIKRLVFMWIFVLISSVVFGLYGEQFLNK